MIVRAILQSASDKLMTSQGVGTANVEFSNEGSGILFRSWLNFHYFAIFHDRHGGGHSHPAGDQDSDNRATRTRLRPRTPTNYNDSEDVVPRFDTRRSQPPDRLRCLLLVYRLDAPLAAESISKSPHFAVPGFTLRINSSRITCSSIKAKSRHLWHELERRYRLQAAMFATS